MRTLCAAFLLNAGTVVSAGSLAAHVWETAAPQRPRDALQVLVVRLRKCLGKQLAARIATVSVPAAAYALSIDNTWTPMGSFRINAGTLEPHDARSRQR